MADYNPRSTNRPTEDAPKSTARWFDDRVDRKRDSKGPCGFQVSEPK